MTLLANTKLALTLLKEELQSQKKIYTDCSGLSSREINDWTMQVLYLLRDGESLPVRNLITLIKNFPIPPFKKTGLDQIQAVDAMLIWVALIDDVEMYYINNGLVDGLENFRKAYMFHLALISEQF